jgi:hypothetical protein
MRNEREDNIFRNIGRIRRRGLIRGGMDSNLLSTKISLIEIIRTNMLRMNSREKTPCEKGADHQSNVGDVRKVSYTRISLTGRIK